VFFRASFTFTGVQPADASVSRLLSRGLGATPAKRPRISWKGDGTVHVGFDLRARSAAQAAARAAEVLDGGLADAGLGRFAPDTLELAPLRRRRGVLGRTLRVATAVTAGRIVR
jgi:hypothetical protein